MTHHKGQIYQSFSSGRDEMYIVLSSCSAPSRVLCARVHDTDITKELENKGTCSDDIILFEDHAGEVYSINMEDIALRDLSNYMYLTMVIDDILIDINESLNGLFELK